MTPKHFDDFTRLLANSASRRHTLRLIAAMLLGAVLPERAGGQVHAQEGDDPCAFVGEHFCQAPGESWGDCCDTDHGATCCSFRDSAFGNGAPIASCAPPGDFCAPWCAGAALHPWLQFCGPGETRCDPCDYICKSLQTDPTNCGTCGNVCYRQGGGRNACVNGKCVTDCSPECSSTEICCDNTCVSTQTDPTNCGTCGHKCPSGQPCVNGQCRGAELRIDSPSPNTRWPITAEPSMPQITARARIVGVTPDPTPTTQFRWTVQIQYKAQKCAHSGQPKNPPDIVQTVVGGQFSPTFQTIRGGDLKFIVSAVVNGETLTASTSGLTIPGTNPSTRDVRALLPNDTLARIACLESGMRQFVAASNGGVGYCPYWSGDNLGGVGIMQLTHPAPTDDEVWNWKDNVNGGIRLFNEKVTQAKAYPGQLVKSAKWKALVAVYNANRRKHGQNPLKSISLPPFDSGQLERETIRLYNGGNQYRPATDANGLLIVTVGSDGTTGTATWEEIPIAAQPHCKTCCPNYVNIVLSQDPICPHVTKGTCCPDRACQ